MDHYVYVLAKAVIKAESELLLAELEHEFNTSRASDLPDVQAKEQLYLQIETLKIKIKKQEIIHLKKQLLQRKTELQATSGL